MIPTSWPLLLWWYIYHPGNSMAWDGVMMGHDGSWWVLDHMDVIGLVQSLGCRLSPKRSLKVNHIEYHDISWHAVRRMPSARTRLLLLQQTHSICPIPPSRLFKSAIFSVKVQCCLHTCCFPTWIVYHMISHAKCRSSSVALCFTKFQRSAEIFHLQVAWACLRAWTAHPPSVARWTVNFKMDSPAFGPVDEPALRSLWNTC